MKTFSLLILATIASLAGCGSASESPKSFVSDIEDSNANVLVSTFLTMPDRRSFSVKLVNREQKALECEITAQANLVLGSEIIGELSLFQKAPLAAGMSATFLMGEEDIRDQTPGVHYRLSGSTTVTRCKAFAPAPVPSPTPSPRQLMAEYVNGALGRLEPVPSHLLDAMCTQSSQACFARDMLEYFDLVLQISYNFRDGVPSSEALPMRNFDPDRNRRLQELEKVMRQILNLAIASIAVGSEDYFAGQKHLFDHALTFLTKDQLVRMIRAFVQPTLLDQEWKSAPSTADLDKAKALMERMIESALP